MRAAASDNTDGNAVAGLGTPGSAVTVGRDGLRAVGCRTAFAKHHADPLHGFTDAAREDARPVAVELRHG